MKDYVRRKPCKLKTNYIYHKMYTCFFLNSRPRKKWWNGRRHFKYLTQLNKSKNLTSNLGMYTVNMSLYEVISD